MEATMQAPTTIDARAQFTHEAEVRSSALEMKVLQIARARRDASADTRALVAVVTPTPDGGLQSDSERVVLTGPGGVRLAVTPLAHDQLAERVGIPKPYYQRMLAGQPDLLAENLNTWLQREPDTRLLRCLMGVTPEDQQLLARTGTQMKLRAVLGRTYRTIDDAEVLAALLPIARQHGAMLSSYDATDVRLHARFVTWEQSVQSIRDRVAREHGTDAALVSRHAQVNGRDVSWVNEVVRTGFYVRNSETGFAALDVASFVEVLKCLNGMIAPAQVKVRHAGTRRGEDDGAVRWLSEGTQALDDAALMSRLQDAARAALDDKSVVALGNTLSIAKGTEVDLGAPVFEWLDRTADKLDLTEVQRDTYKQETTLAIAQEQREIGRPNVVTQFALVQGLTALARQVTDTDRRTELERTGWSWLEGTTQQLVAMGEAAARKRRN